MSWGFRIKRNKTDKAFSDLVRAKAGWKCERCGKEPERQYLHCSHFIGRGNKKTRWDLENAASLCSYCHRKFTEDTASHYQFFEKRLGKEKLESLIIRSRLTLKESDVTEESIQLGLLEELKNYKK